MATRKKWTDEEDKILVQAIKANPHNKQQVFREIAEKTGHTVTSCSSRWYTILSNPEHKKYISEVCFTMVGVSSKLANRSINRDKVHIVPTKTKKGLWVKIKALLGF